MTLIDLIDELSHLVKKTENGGLDPAQDIPIRVVIRKPNEAPVPDEAMQYELIGVQKTEGWESDIVLIFAGDHAATSDWPTQL
ncbi:hypothetical protein MesoLj131b_07830 [Mesorhizobium sp. 131-2-5]|uniref:hypothetical protein n=1 Tax=Mesorhizobium sp. 131-2-5 TaxID=2744519 RepID=UPI0019266574|nr:hypothetical protein [Mesorhizobium sp. 131-2-5]BCG98783.1 hypothetical protein MesoLj131b_07830 [Mesorhizobium sp. 131-2-5]